MRVDEHSSELGTWQTAQRAADPRLDAFVHGYFASSSQLAGPIRERHLPSLEVPLVLNFGAPHYRVVDDVPQQLTQLDEAWVVGLHSGYQVTEAVGERHFMVVRFTPLGAHLFFGTPMHLLVNRAIAIELVDRNLAQRIISRVGAARSWRDRFAAMDTLIAERVAGRRVVPPVALVWRRLVAAEGQVVLGELARQVDCSRRSLIAHFRTCVGFPPKTVAKLLRFNRVVALLNSPGESRPPGKPYIESDACGGRPRRALPWADVAAECGYFDQAHLINEFRQFAGTTPTRVLQLIAD